MFGRGTKYEADIDAFFGNVFLAFLLVVFFELFDIDISGLVLPLLWILVVFVMYLSAKRIFSWRKDDFETKDDTGK